MDCQNASICTYVGAGGNVTKIVRKKLRPNVDLDYDNGDIRRLKKFFQPFVDKLFNRIIVHNDKLAKASAKALCNDEEDY